LVWLLRSYICIKTVTINKKIIMKKSLLSVALALIFVSFGFSQSLVQIGNGTGTTGGSMAVVLVPSTPVNVANIAGSPYIPADFVPGKVSTMPNQIYMVRYNAVNDEMVVKDNNKALALNKDIAGVYVTVMGSKKRYQTFKTADSEKSGFFVIESNPNSKIKLLNKEYVQYIDKQVAANSYQSDRPAKFKRANDIFYLSTEENTAVLMPKKKKDFIKLFPNKDVTKFIKKERISLKDKKDLIKLVNFLNSNKAS